MSESFKEYKAAKDFAIGKVREMRIAYGIEKNKLFNTWSVFMLPKKENRYGFELRCEALEPEDYKPLNQ